MKRLLNLLSTKKASQDYFNNKCGQGFVFGVFIFYIYQNFIMKTYNLLDNKQLDCWSQLQLDKHEIQEGYYAELLSLFFTLIIYARVRKKVTNFICFYLFLYPSIMLKAFLVGIFVAYGVGAPLKYILPEYNIGGYLVYLCYYLVFYYYYTVYALRIQAKEHLPV